MPQKYLLFGVYAFEWLLIGFQLAMSLIKQWDLTLSRKVTN